ncbi:MAG: hypothetical protein KF789_07420 [Bdellovibrionaceae bacterium]|nr:hypothetical protein [Pseudobdellovibrionaceae bacterium]
MSRVDQEILSEFLAESKSLVSEAGGILEAIEGEPKLSLRLLEYANRVDRIMGAARSLATLAGPDHALHLLGDYTGLCKAVGTRGAQLASKNEQIFDVTVSFLLDANDFISELLPRLDEPASVLKKEMQGTFVDRLRWLADLYRAAPEEKKAGPAGGLGQGEIDELLKRLGI